MNSILSINHTPIQSKNRKFVGAEAESPCLSRCPRAHLSGTAGPSVLGVYLTDAGLIFNDSSLLPAPSSHQPSAVRESCTLSLAALPPCFYSPFHSFRFTAGVEQFFWVLRAQGPHFNCLAKAKNGHKQHFHFKFSSTLKWNAMFLILNPHNTFTVLNTIASICPLIMSICPYLRPLTTASSHLFCSFTHSLSRYALFLANSSLLMELVFQSNYFEKT